MYYEGNFFFDPSYTNITSSFRVVFFTAAAVAGEWVALLLFLRPISSEKRQPELESEAS